MREEDLMRLLAGIGGAITLIETILTDKKQINEYVGSQSVYQQKGAYPDADTYYPHGVGLLSANTIRQPAPKDTKKRGDNTR